MGKIRAVTLGDEEQEKAAKKELMPDVKPKNPKKPK